MSGPDQDSNCLGLLDLIWVQSVCKSYQKTAPVSKEPSGFCVNRFVFLKLIT